MCRQKWGRRRQGDLGLAENSPKHAAHTSSTVLGALSAALSCEVLLPKAHPPGSCGPVLIRWGIAGRGTLPPMGGTVSFNGAVACCFDSWPMIGGDCAGEMTPLDRLAKETGEGLLELSCTIPGPVETLRPGAPCRLADDCLAMPTALLDDGASISKPSSPREVTLAPARASTASSSTAGTV